MSKLLPQETPLTVFVGRSAELKQLVGGLDRAFEGRGGMFLLSGEPGIGKTRVAEQLDIEAQKRGSAVYWGRSTQAEGAPPYWPWIQILRSLLADLGGAQFGRLAGPGLARILQVVPDLRGHFPSVATTSMDDDQTRFGTYDSVTQLLLDTAATRPMVLVLDDLHWADTASLLLLQLLAGLLPHSHLMVIGTYRDLELAASHPLRTHLADFVRRGETTEIPIAGLKDPEVSSLFRALTGFEPAGDIVRRLQAQTAGNPFFLSELAWTLGDLGQESPKWSFPASAEAVPRGIGAVLRRRIEALSADCRGALEIAAVTGQKFDLDLLEAATGTKRPRLLDLFDEAIAKGVVTRLDGGYAFTHGLVRDTVYSGISTARRCELHGLIGRLLEDGPHGDSGMPVAQLAHHFVEASVVDQSLRAKALDYVSAAGRRALAELAYEEAVRLFELALSQIAPLDPGQRAELLLDLGRARYLAGDVGAALEAAHEVARLGEKLGDSNLVARAALVVRGVGDPRVMGLCNAALRQPPEDASLRIQLLSQMTVVLMQMPGGEDERRAIEYSRQALQLAQDAVDPDVIFAAIHARQMAMSGPSGVDERLQLADRTLDLARESGRPSMAGWGHGWRVDALVQLGRIDEAQVQLALQAQLAEQLREPLLQWRTRLAQSWVAMLRGRFEEARTISNEALQLGRRGHNPAADFIHLMHVTVLPIFVGDPEGSFDAVQGYARDHPELRIPLEIMSVGSLLSMGRLEDVRQAMRPFATGGPEAVRPVMAWLPAMAGFTQAITALGDVEQAAIAYEALLPYAHYNVATGAGLAGLYGSVSHFLGMLAATLERWDDASQHFEDAMAFESRMGAPPFVVCTRVVYADMLVARGHDADLRRARRLVDAAIATSRELGMKPWEDRATKLASALAGRAVADHPLSSREFEVATLVAEGLSNREIAGRLHLSERTSESHVKNICDKLGFNSRSQVAAWVAKRPTTQ
ncbi:MAG TPA: AAA family ATPase [Candidatus Dormibacteraeota bacterium]|nr:AAA family ATPase [Candidatus Dormibacteraeota bacterium]